MMNNIMTCKNNKILRYTLSIFMATVCLTLTAAPAGAQDELLHDSMHQGAHPEFKWYTTLVSWRFSLDGFVSGLPDIGFRSAIISGISFDESADTFMVIARIDRNDVAMYYIGYTDVRPDFHNYSHEAITCGIYVDSLGTLSPSWDAGNEEYWGASLPEGVYDLRIMIDRVNSGMIVAFDPVPAYDVPLSSFDSPVLSITEHVDLAEILYIQMNLYNQSSAVFDAWSTEGTPSLLMIHHPRFMVVMEGDTIEFEAAAEYDGEKQYTLAALDELTLDDQHSCSGVKNPKMRATRVEPWLWVCPGRGNRPSGAAGRRQAHPQRGSAQVCNDAQHSEDWGMPGLRPKRC